MCQNFASWLAASALCLTVNVLPAEAQNALTPIPQDTAVLVGRLDNGLTYIIRHNTLPRGVADFYIAQKVGAILEEDNQDGLAHFLEHMAFNGTQNFPGKALIDCLERVGVRFGENLNAYTSLDETVYNIANVPTETSAIVDSALLILHDWGGLLTLDGTEIDKERGVIREEWRTRASASRRLFFGHMAATMPGTRYAVRDVIGDTAVINNFSHKALRDYYHKWYRPDQQGIVVVGDVSPSDIEARIRRLWSDMPPRTDLAPRPYYDVPLPSKPLASVLTDPEATLTYFDIQYRYKPEPDSIRNSVQYYAVLLTSQLAQMVFNTRMQELAVGGAPFSQAYMSDRSLTPTLNCVSFGCYAKNGQTSAAFDLLLSEMERLRRFGVNTGELQRAATELLKSYDDAYNERLKTESDDYVQQYYTSFLGRDVISSIDTERELAHSFVPMLDVATVNKFITAAFQSSPPVAQVSAMAADTGVLTAEGYCERLTKAGELDVKPYEEHAVRTELCAAPKKSGKVKKWEEDAVYGARIATLSNGLRVWLKPTDLSDNEVKMVAVSRGGYSTLGAELAPSAGLSGLFASYMGLGDFSLPELQRALAGKTASVGASLSPYSEQLSGGCAKGDVETMLQLFHMSFAPRRSDAQAYEALMQRFESQLETSSKDPDSVFGDTVQVLAADHNAYNPVICTPAELRRDVDLQRILRSYNARFSTADGFEFALVGTFDIDSITPLLCKWIATLPVNGKRATVPVDRGLYAPQRQVASSFTWPMETKKTSCYRLYSGRAPYDRLEQIGWVVLGRLLDMRYLESVREDEGGSYGVSVNGGLSREPNAQWTLRVSFDTNPALYDKLRPIIDAEIERIATEGPLAADLEKIKTNLVKKRAEQLQGNAAWLNLISSRISYGDDDTHFNDTVAKVDAALVKRLAATALRGHRLEVVMTGE